MPAGPDESVEKLSGLPQKVLIQVPKGFQWLPLPAKSEKTSMVSFGPTRGLVPRAKLFKRWRLVVTPPTVTSTRLLAAEPLLRSLAVPLR